MTLSGKSILLIVTGGIAACKSSELVRLFKKAGADVHVILTKSGAEFVTPMTLQTLSQNKVHTDLFDLENEQEIGHIELSRQADVVLVAPATANIMAKTAQGLCSDLATTCLLATDKPVFIAPAMNVKMWEHPATQRNLAQLKTDGMNIINPTEGEMACGEYGIGRMAEPEDIYAVIKQHLSGITQTQSLKGKHAIVTAGPTREPLDPVRYISNRSSGKQGYAIAKALAKAGTQVTLVSGPTQLSSPRNVTVVQVETATEMLTACEHAHKQSKADIFIGAAAVSDFSFDAPEQKIKKQLGALCLPEIIENPDILKTFGQHTSRPALVIGFALETEKLEKNARKKLTSKSADWILGNLSDADNKAFDAQNNTITFVSTEGDAQWPLLDKSEIAQRLVDKITAFFYDDKVVKLKTG